MGSRREDLCDHLLRLHILEHAFEQIANLQLPLFEFSVQVGIVVKKKKSAEKNINFFFSFFFFKSK